MLNHVAPIKQVKLKQRTNPWMNQEIWDTINAWDLALYRKFNDPHEYRSNTQIMVKKSQEIILQRKDTGNQTYAKEVMEHFEEFGYQIK